MPHMPWALAAASRALPSGRLRNPDAGHVRRFCAGRLAGSHADRRYPHPTESPMVPTSLARHLRCRAIAWPGAWSVRNACQQTSSQPATRRYSNSGVRPAMHFCSATANCLPSAWGMGISCTLRDLANLPKPCPITHDTATRACLSCPYVPATFARGGVRNKRFWAEPPQRSVSGGSPPGTPRSVPCNSGVRPAAGRR